MERPLNLTRERCFYEILGVHKMWTLDRAKGEKVKRGLECSNLSEERGQE